MSMARGGARIRTAGAATGLLLPGLLLIFGCLFIPLVTLFRYSFKEYDPMLMMRDVFTLENYARFFAEPYYQGVMVNTLYVALTSTIITAVLAFPVAYFLARTKSRFKSLLVISVVFPLMIGNVVRAAGWIALFGSRGIINVTLLKMGLIDQPLQILNTDFAVIVGTVSVVLPFMILSLQSAIENVDFSVVDAALNLGASRSQAFVRVFFPIVLPGVITGFVLVFILCMNAYATPFLLGGPGYRMMAPVLYNEITTVANWPFGSAIAFILMTVTIVVTVAMTRLIGKTRPVRKPY